MKSTQNKVFTRLVDLITNKPIQNLRELSDSYKTGWHFKWRVDALVKRP